MANTKAYIQSLQNKDGADVYPVTVADAVYVQKSDGSTVTQTKLSAKLTEMEKNFTDGCNTIVSALTELGVTPEATTPTGIAAAIKKLYSDRYTSGVEQGHKDVIADPGGYGLITKTDYDNYGKEQYNAGITFADSRVNTESASYVTGTAYGKKTAKASISFSRINTNPYTDSYGSWVNATGYGALSVTLADGKLSAVLSGYGSGEIVGNDNQNHTAVASYSGSQEVNVE